MGKKVIFIADSLDNAHKFQQVLSHFDVEVLAGSSLNFRKLITQNDDCDLVIYEVKDDAAALVADVEPMLIEANVSSMLLIINQAQLTSLRLPVQLRSDFIMNTATPEECAARIRMMILPGNESSANDIISIDDMVINLATYQVKINSEPIDLTYLEYALLAFLATHPGRTYSRDTLLRRVWGFDYYGGSRTVDVHVRRVRAKLGPELAQRLETVRGVGYLWNM